MTKFKCLTSSDLNNGKVQISKLFPNISELFHSNSELYSESPATGNGRSYIENSFMLLYLYLDFLCYRGYIKISTVAVLIPRYLMWLYLYLDIHCGQSYS